MLVLTRKREQKIQIGRHVTVTILGVRGGAVRIGIEAPPDVKILRSELSVLPPSHGQHDAAGTSRGRSSQAAPHPDCGLPRHASGSEADEGAASADPPPRMTAPRPRPALMRVVQV